MKKTESMSNTTEGNLKEWFATHKKAVCVGGGVVISVVISSLIVYKNRDQVASVLVAAKNGLMRQGISKIGETAEAVTKTVAKTPDLSSVKLTGKMNTATQLGQLTYKSAQEINKRIINNGLAERLPDGTLNITELGSRFGDFSTKTRAWGHEFTNIVWDSSIIPLIFSQEELESIEKTKEELKPIHDYYSNFNYTGIS